MSQNAWHSAQEEFHGILSRLERDGPEIGLRASQGDENAKEIIRLYTLLHRSFDPMTVLLLKEALAKEKQ